MIVLPELAAALSRMQRLSRFGKSFMNNAFARFRSDLRQRLFYHHPLDEQTLFLASDLALRHPLKGYDAVQVASALLAQQQLERAEVTFVSSDQQVLRVAEAEGLATDDPEQHSEGSQ